MRIELKTNIKVSQGKNISASVVTEMEQRNDFQIAAMREMLEEIVKGYCPQPVEVKTQVNKGATPKMISEKQIGMIRYLAKSTQTPESDLCRKYSVGQLNELTMANARTLIQDLKSTVDFTNN